MIVPYHKMNTEKLERLLKDNVRNLTGGEGQWEFSVRDVRMYCLIDEMQDRMRVMAPIAELKELPDGALKRCMEANFDRTMDVRYCIYSDHLWSAFVHPLSELSEDMLESALGQIANSLKNFGTSYASGELVFSAENSAR